MRRFLVGLALVTVTVAAPALAERRDQGDLGEQQRALQHKQKQLREERARATEARKREASLLAELEGTEKRIATKRRQVAALDARVKKVRAEVAGLEREIARLEAQRSGQEDALARRLRLLYMLQSQGGALPLVLSGDDPLARAVRLRHLATLATVDANLIREYRGTSEDAAERKVRVEAQRRELTTLLKEADEERAAADREAARRRALLAKVRDERTYHDRMVQELSEATRRLEAFIKELQARQRRVAARPPAGERPRTDPGEPGTGASALRGRLAWPADGKVVGDFGLQIHPRFGTKTFRNGIDIEVAEGTNITAAQAGQVMYTGWFRGYGNLVILDHGAEFYTLYAHLAQIGVAEGDDVRQGQAIGTVGDTGALQGPRLYFEVRSHGKPVDPAQWLRPRG